MGEFPYRGGATPRPPKPRSRVEDELADDPIFRPTEVEDRGTLKRRTPTATEAEVFGKRIDALFDVLGPDPGGRWNGAGQMFAHMVGVHSGHVSKWRRARRAIPRYVWLVLNCVAALAETHGRDAVLRAIMDHGLLEENEHGTTRVLDYEIPEHKDLRLRA